MSDLDQLQQKLESEVGENTFSLEQRTATQLLNNISDYTSLIPFASNQKELWNTFWFAEQTPEQLGAIYQAFSQADKKLPVQQTFLLVLLRLLETPRLLLNTLPGRHRSLYYHDLLGFTRKSSQPDRVMVNFSLRRDTAQYLLPAGTELAGGQDAVGNNITYLTDDSLLISRQQLSTLCWTRQSDSSDSDWLLCTALDVDNKIDLPENGVRLFGETDHETALTQTLRLATPLATLKGELQEVDGVVTLNNCQDIDYRAQDNHGHINAFSYPFGVSPQSGNAFELTLPAAFSQSGGELTIEPQWHGLPAESFAHWYADYPNPPADNSLFKARVYLITPEGSQLQGEEQSLFSGEGEPQGLPLHVRLPADPSPAAVGYTVRVELSDTDFLHRAWQADPTGKNAAWTPQVSRIDSQFQYERPQADAGQDQVRLQDTPTTKQALYLGFSDVVAGETLSVYWSLNAPSALDLKWYCYSKQNGWTPLEAGLKDGTSGLYASGLWQAILPDDISVGGDGLSENYHWIKAVPDSGVAIVPTDAARLQAIIANATTATLNTATDVDDSHFLQALPAGTISQLVSPIAEISNISQPLPSTDGKVSETETELFQRVAARLSHRNRAITWGNIRTMVIEKYPQIYDVKFPEVGKLNHIPALEEQTLMVIPHSLYSDTDDLLRPALSAGRLSEMTDWLSQYTSLWATPELVNPLYVDVTALYQVVFTAGTNPDYGYRQLAAQLQQQYMPWGEDRQQGVTPGNQVDYYALLATLQQSPLVQRVTSLTLTRSGGTAQQQTITAQDNEVLILIPQAAITSLNGESHV